MIRPGIDDLSPQQLSALLDESPRVLVAAGAGSGKTRLLVAHFVRALVEEGIPAGHMFAVTFTRKAAAELVSRIREKLQECGRPDLARSVDAATVGTIHSLCRRLVREYSVEAGVDPACGVLEAGAAALAKDMISRQAWEKVVERAGDAELEALAAGRDGLREEMVELYDRLRGVGVERPQVHIHETGDTEARVAGVLNEAVLQALFAGYASGRTGVALQQDLEKLEKCRDWLTRAPSQTGRDEVLEVTGEFFPSRRTPSLEAAFVPVRQALTRYRSVFAVERLRPLAAAMNELLAEFHDRYEAYKSERGVLDFSDLELRARSLVQNKGSALSRGVSASRLLVDEFQDTNELQCSILEGLGAGRLVMVGDERQSIYRFRGADVSVFRDRQRSMSTAGASAPRDRTAGLHRLSVNYRSRPEILDFINRLFAHRALFGPDFFRLEVSAGKAAPAKTPGAPPAVQVFVAERQDAADPECAPSGLQEAEAEVVAACIRGALDEEGRSQRDIVVLVPAQTNVDAYRRALAARGVDVYVVRGKGYYRQDEVADVLALLRLIVYPHDDLALLTALRSPLVGLSDDALYLLGRGDRQHSLWEVVRTGTVGTLPAEDRRRLAAFAERVAELRGQVGRPGLARLMDDAISSCDYDLSALAQPDGRRRFANIRKLMRIADEFESVEGPDLAGFVDSLESIGDLSDQEGSAPTLAEGEDVVRIMTVHQAKGLEFPMVVLAGLGSDVRHDGSGRFLVGSDGRMGVSLRDSARGPYESADLSWGPADQIADEERAKELEEDGRLMYVAMTRAEERLVLVGARPKGDGLGGCRIGRIAAALDLDALPEEGEVMVVEGLDATVEAVGRARVPVMGPVPDKVLVTRTADTDVGTPETPRPACLPKPSPICAPAQVSFSALAAYRRCPRRYYFERVLGLSLPVESAANGSEGEASPAEAVHLDDDERGSGLEVGLLVHALLEQLPGHEGPPGEGVLRATAAEWLADSSLRLDSTGFDRAIDLVRSFWDSPVAWVGSHPAAMREAPFFYAQGDVLISGVVDLVVRTGDLWHIVDYKTNSLRGRSPAEVALDYELQAAVYCLAAIRAGASAVHMHFVFLERPAEPVTVRHEADSASALERMLDEALEGLTEGLFPSRDGAGCASCPATVLCAGMALD